MLAKSKKYIMHRGDAILNICICAISVGDSVAFG